MIYTDDYRAFLIEQNKKEYGDNYKLLKFPDIVEIKNAVSEREEILSSLGEKVNFGFKGTKVYTGSLSPGCKICSNGMWSCLFINGLCNCRCFYCPAKQEETDEPTTNTVSFPDPRDYVDYIDKFYFEGVSISGGEPFNTFERSLEYIKAVKKRFGNYLHLWLYTNGTKVTKEKLIRLRNAGLDEIRFDIGATKYNLKKAASAVGLIPIVTVEIPAIPEEFDLMKKKIKEMSEAGINHLNLHQLRLTPFNFKNLVSRNYTFLHGEKVTVLESELTALKLIKYSIENEIDLPVNYCSFVYKNRFQKAAARKRNAMMIKKSFQSITENGYIRYMFITGNLTDVKHQYDSLIANGVKEQLFQATKHFERLYFHSSIWSKIDLSRCRLNIGYEETSIHSKPTYLSIFKEIELNKERKLFVEKFGVTAEIALEENDIEIFKNILRNKSINDVSIGEDIAWRKIIKHELIPGSLQVYF